MEIDGMVRKLNSLSEDVGAVVVFAGIVRSEGGRVKKLKYEVYESMFRKVVEEIRREAMKKFPVFGVEIEHRFGEFPPGDIVFLVGVAARHREEAFEACRWVVDEFKSRAPVWKKEVGEEERWL